jgi:hypothetical protein
MDELKLDPRPVDPASIPRMRHYSRTDYTQTALGDVVCFDGSKPVCTPVGATDAMLDGAQVRLGFALPEALRAIYRLRNGASVGSLWVPKVAKPKNLFDDWEDAFANDYNDILPLEDLRTLQAIYLDGFDPEYDEDERQNWFPESERLVVIAKRGGRGTALDYRQGGAAGVLLFDLECEGDSRERLKFASFDAFLAALRREKELRRAPYVATDEAPDAQAPDRFWCFDTYAATSGASAHAWQAEGARLGVELPGALRPFYEAVNGGNTRFLLQAGSEIEADHPDPQGLVPGRGIREAARLLPIEAWVSLRTLSDRLSFQPEGRATWAELWAQADRLIVVSAAFDGALLLDYRNTPTPNVLRVHDLNDPTSVQRFESVAQFLAALRPARQGKRELHPPMGDKRLSARVAAPASMWQAPGENPPAAEALITKTSKRLRIEIGERLAALYSAQDGGAVRFRFFPPEVENIHGYRNEDVEAPVWVDFFPGGLLPMARWQLLSDWAKTEGCALDAEPLLASNMKHSSDVKPKFVVLSEQRTPQGAELALLDVSESYFHRQNSLVRARWLRSSGAFELVVSQQMLEHSWTGVLQRLRAIREN